MKKKKVKKLDLGKQTIASINFWKVLAGKMPESMDTTCETRCQTRCANSVCNGHTELT